MKQIIVEIPEKEYPFFMRLVKSLSFVKVETEDLEIPESEKKLVRKRIKNSGPGKIRKWDQVKDSFDF